MHSASPVVPSSSSEPCRRRTTARVTTQQLKRKPDDVVTAKHNTAGTTSQPIVVKPTKSSYYSSPVIPWHLLRFLPSPHVVDLRSLAALRVLLAVYILLDVRYRLIDGRASLSWYTSTTGAGPDDLPPIYDGDGWFEDSDQYWTDEIWCFRGTPQQQATLFTINVILAILFGLGIFCGGVVPVLFWLSVSGTCCRTPDVDYNDSSDSLAANLLLWCTVLPDLNGIWSVDAWWTARRRAQRKGGGQVPMDNNKIVTAAAGSGRTISTIATLGITTQVFLVYLGLITNRYFHGTQGFYPEYSFVYYALSVPRYTRQHIANLIQTYPDISKLMTMCSWFLEGVCPIWAYLSPYDAFKGWSRTIPALLISVFHLSLWACIRIPAYQWICALEVVVFLPGSFWDFVERMVVGKYRDGITDSRVVDGEKKKEKAIRVTTVTKQNDTKLWYRMKRLFTQVISLLLFVCMICLFLVGKGWADFETGYGATFVDIGYRLHFYQYWNIFGPDAPTDGTVCIMTGRYENERYGWLHAPPNMDVDEDYEWLRSHRRPIAIGTRKDLLAAIRTHDWSSQTDMTPRSYVKGLTRIPHNMSSHFSHWRWESVILEQIDFLRDDEDWNDRKDYVYEGLVGVCRFVCAWSNRELERLGGEGNQKRKRLSHVELEYMEVEVMPMEDTGHRYYHIDDETWRFRVLVECND